MLVSTHNLGSVPRLLRPGRADQPHGAGRRPDRAKFHRRPISSSAFGGVLRHFRLGGADLHDDADTRSVTVLTDDERPLVFYGDERRRRSRRSRATSDK